MLHSEAINLGYDLMSKALIPGSSSAAGSPENRAGAAPIAILLIEDDRHIQRSISYQLSRQGYQVTCCEDGEEGLEKALQGQHQVVILDIMLPRLDGLSICKRLRGTFPELPIIITSARGTDLDKITGLEFGADDYLSKPFSPAELEARIRAVRRRAQSGSEGPQPRLLELGQVTLDRDRRLVRVAGEPIRLTPKEFELLHLLMQHPGRVFTRESLLSHIWGYAYDGYNRAIDAHINRLRSKLQEPLAGGPELIEAVYGVGYRFREP
ncbi:MAG: response regulator transcription factor [Terriglobales bacterium]